MQKVDKDLIEKVANLAKLDLTASEADQMVVSIGEILGHIEQLNSVNVDGVEPLIHGIDTEDSLQLRDDVVVSFPTDNAGNPKILNSAPDVLHQGFKVPPIL